MTQENITLFYKQAKSDKVYKASLEKHDDLYIVNFAYGRRGATLRTGTKTQSPVAYEKAKKIYDKLVRSKSAKGYLPEEDNSDYIYTSDQVQTDIRCQLLNPIDENDVASLHADDTWWAQEKMDGKRMLLQKQQDVVAINRKGLVVGAPKAMIDAALAVDYHFIIDGEAIGDVLYVFDLLSFDNVDIKHLPYSERYQKLSTLAFLPTIQVVKTAKSTQEKQALYQQLQKASAEGIVYKKHASLYHAGRPNSGGDQRKFKFYETASVVVAKVNDKRSVGMQVYDEQGQAVFIGNVTIATNKDIPQENTIIEVRYLYAYQGGSLYQPTFLNSRSDIDHKDCSIKQLKYKQDI